MITDFGSSDCWSIEQTGLSLLKREVICVFMSVPEGTSCFIVEINLFLKRITLKQSNGKCSSFSSGLVSQKGQSLSSF